MSAGLLRALTAIAVAVLLFVWSARRQRRGAQLGRRLQTVGAIGLLTVAVAHLCESLRLFPRMGWGQAHSPGHYVDLSGAILGLTLTPVGYLLSRHASARRQQRPAS